MTAFRKHHISVTHAVSGIYTALATQPNFRVHITLSLLAVGLGLSLDLSRLEWAAISFVIAAGLGFELLNTSIEFVVDLLTDQHHLLAKHAKDTAAAAMLVYAAGSVVVAGFIFIPKLLLLFIN
ncbi:hypothetical protein A2395_04285 [Candidatus Amesbacteria bacterium RIFOXYB1_FULL_47_9]|uniref:Diacylglycerol kinase n=1 Tax=Candidatus Amesbacteria bacterium RIFOXYB1_FULL_47_9 TaxID=1797266 RepID=A0A1F4ZWC3_9BACT|nr:MAG: hypothetical protein A2395_04285 [Candidatus Amesbacteria bacterium RIFOXYB1_FULL_47_9]